MSDEPSGRERANGTSNNDESSTSKGAKGRNKESNLFLMSKHPELFTISPRPGGFLKHLAARRNSRNVVERSDKAASPAPVATNINTAGRASIGEILETSIRCPSARRPVSKEDNRNNTVRMCSIAISTVMMLAQHIHNEITSEHVKHTEEYFRGLKQVDGYPHNVGQLMQLLANLKRSGKIVASSVEEDNVHEEHGEGQHSEIQMSDLIS